MLLSLYLVLLPQLLSVLLLHLQHSPPLCGILGVVELFEKKTEKSNAIWAINTLHYQIYQKAQLNSFS